MPMRASEVALAHRACFALLAALLSGCAGFTTANVDTEEADAKARGFRYYESAPFLVVFYDGEEFLTTEVLFLPDTTRKRSIQPYSYAASNKATFTFAEGRLTGAKAVVDETVLPSAIISALEKAALADLRSKAKEAKPEPSLHLFRIVKRCGDWHLAGTKRAPRSCPGDLP
jgi:hypothetical protein